MSLFKEIWSAQIQEQLREGTDFLNYMDDFSELIVSSDTGNAAYLHIPQAGSDPRLYVNPQAFPLQASKRTDADKVVQLDLIATERQVLQDIETKFISYNKIQSVMAAHTARLVQGPAALALLALSQNFVASGKLSALVRTSGSAGSGNGPAASNRKLLTREDVKNAALALDKQNVPQQGRYMLMNRQMFYELFSDTQLLSSFVMGKTTLPTGVITDLFGFNIIIRPSVGLFDSSLNAKSIFEADYLTATSEANTDHYACLFWQQNMVAKAMSAIDVVTENYPATYMGTVVGAHTYFGVASKRNDQRGYGAIIQAS